MEGVPTDVLLDSLTGPWSLVLMSVLVLGDAFLVVIPGEIAVTALGAIAASAGSPPLWAVIACAALAATAGDVVCFLIGRLAGTERWRWMRAPKVQQAISWARGRLDAGLATVLFTARFVPFARLAVNLAAGASGIRPIRYLALVSCAAAGWAVYQASVGAVIATLLPGGPLVAVPVSIVVAVGIGLAIDAITRRVGR